MSTGQATATNAGPSNKVLLICGGQVALCVAWIFWLFLSPTNSDLAIYLETGSFFAGLPFWAVMMGLDLWFLRRGSAADTWLIATGLIVSTLSAFLTGCVTALLVVVGTVPI